MKQVVVSVGLAAALFGGVVGLSGANEAQAVSFEDVSEAQDDAKVVYEWAQKVWGFVAGSDRAYSEECVNEGCNNEEVEELYAYYKEECLQEGCNDEEPAETAHLDKQKRNAIFTRTMYMDFQARGWQLLKRHRQ